MAKTRTSTPTTTTTTTATTLETEVAATDKAAEQAALGALDIKAVFEKLVPPTNITISDIFGNDYSLSSTVSARKQVVILREFETIQDIQSQVELKDGSIAGIVDLISSICQQEEFLLALCRCFSTAHPKTLESAKKMAKKAKAEYEEGDFAPADLFALEELAAAIVPLFIRLAKRAGMALTTVVQVA